MFVAVVAVLEYLDGDFFLFLVVESLEHFSEGALADRLDDLVAVAQVLALDRLDVFGVLVSICVCCGPWAEPSFRRYLLM